MFAAMAAEGWELRLYPSVLARDRAVAAQGEGRLTDKHLVFAELFADLATVDPSQARQHLDGLRQWLVVRQILLGVPADGSFAHVAHQPAGVWAMVDALAELRRSGLTAEHFSRARNGLSAALQGLGAILSGYERALRRMNATDTAERQRLAVYSLVEGLPATLAGLVRVSVVNAGTPLDAAQLDLLTALARHGIDIDVHVPWDADRSAAYAWPEASAHAIEDRSSASINLLTERPRGDDRAQVAAARPTGGEARAAQKSRALTDLLRLNFHSDPHLQDEAAGERITVVRVSTVAEESRLVATQVCGLLSDGFASEDICIVVPDPPLQAPLIRQELAAHGVPTRVAGGSPLSSFRVGRALIAAFDAAVSGYQRESLLELWHVFSPPLGGAHRGALATVAHRLRRAGARSRRVGGFKQALVRHEQGRYRKNAADLAWAEEVGDAIEAFIDSLEQLPQQGGTAAMLRQPQRVLNRLRQYPTQTPTELGAEDDPVGPVAVCQAGESRALECLQELVDTLAAASSGLTPAAAASRMQRQELAQLLHTLLQRTMVPEPQFAPGRVYVGGPETLVENTFDCVIWAGVNAETFPRPQASDVVLSEDVRAQINRFSGPRLLQFGAVSGRAALPATSRDLWFWLEGLRAVGERLLVTCPINEGSDHTGHSPVVEELARRCGLDLRTTAAPDAAGERLTSTREALLQAARISRTTLVRPADYIGHLGGDGTCADPADSAGVVWPNDTARERLRGVLSDWRTNDSPLADRWSWVLWRAQQAERHRPLSSADQKYLSQYFLADTHSTSKLDALGTCGYRHFAGAVCGLGRLDSPTLSADPREQGSAAHAALQVVYADVIAAGGLRAARQDPSAALARAEKAFWSAADEVAAELQVHPYLQQVTLEAAWLAARCQLQADLVAPQTEALEPVALEYRFDDRPGSDAPALEVAHPHAPHSVTVRGSIDRIDAGRTAVNTLDYKRTIRKRAARRHFQLPLYALVAAEHFGKDKALQSEWVELRTLRRHSAADGPQDYEGFARQVREDLWQRIDRTLSGDISPDPDPLTMCDMCDFRSLCRFDVLAAQLTLARRVTAESVEPPSRGKS